MSWWFVRRDQDGRRALWAVDVEPMAVISALAILAAVLSLNGLACFTLLGVGFMCFLIAKLSVVRRSVRISWGSRLMAPRYARLYRAGYLLMVAGGALCLLLRT